jgi:putative heme-binding domain-containing protein
MRFPHLIAWTLVAAVQVIGAPVWAQHESAGAIEEGRTIYNAVCANCHGPDGDQIRGINFSRGQFRRPLSDADLNLIIRTGIPGTPMPGTNVPEDQAARIVAYLRSLAESMTSGAVAGDKTRGKAIFDGKGGCVSCHAVNGHGSRVGPDLSAIGSLRRGVELEQSLLEPAAEVLPQNRTYRVVTSDGKTVTGRLLNQDTFTVQLIDGDERLRSFDKSTLREHGFAESVMPSYRGKLEPQELADVVGYLASLKRR